MSSCEKDWIDVLGALLTPTIAIAAVCIAAFQLRLANTRVKFDLFEKRYAVYSSVSQFIGKTLSIGNSTLEMQREYLNGTNSAKFLFDETYAEFIHTVYCEVIDLETACAIIAQPSSEKELQEHVQKRAEVKKSLAKRLGELNELSKPYLKLREIL